MSFLAKNGGEQNNIELVPFFKIDYQRYTVYWNVYSSGDFVYHKRILTDKVDIDDTGNEKDHGPGGEWPRGE